MKKVGPILGLLFKNDFPILEFLSELVELLLFILLSDEDFQCKSLRYILREVLSNWIIFPVFKLLSDPDYINQVIIWLVSPMFFTFLLCNPISSIQFDNGFVSI